ncbi:MAG: topoisomerase C-terminal repeat-containing protein, partial [Microcystis panniformis]
MRGWVPSSRGKIKASLGRFGPYVVQEEGKEKEYRSLKASDDVLTIT